MTKQLRKKELAEGPCTSECVCVCVLGGKQGETGACLFMRAVEIERDSLEIKWEWT